MSNRKATFAKRQRETELKDHARIKDERRNARRSETKVSKGPEIDWGQAINTANTKIDDVIPTGPGEGATNAFDAIRDMTPEEVEAAAAEVAAAANQAAAHGRAQSLA